MDVAFNQHSSHIRRKNRSTTTLNRLSLAPLTSKLPLDDHDDFPDPLSAPPHQNTSYLQAKSSPTTPRLLSRSPGRSYSHTRVVSTPAASLPKSKSATHLVSNGSHSTSDVSSPRHRWRRDDVVSVKDENDTDWLIRASALISSETRESKGQSWLVSRASSTSLAGVRDGEEEAFERELAREREWASRHASRRGSAVHLDDDRLPSPPTSRFGSRSHSRVGSRNQAMTPLEQRPMDGYFAQQDDRIVGPDFVNLDERLEAIEQDTTQEDEAHVRRLVKRGSGVGVGTWFDSVLGLGLFSVEENEEESDSDGEGTDGGAEEVAQERRRSSSARQFEGVTTAMEERMPPPRPDEGGWQDAAWLLSVASKVLL